MTDELVRAVIAVPIAVLLPLAKRRPPGRPVRVAIAAAVVLAALAPYLDGRQAWVSVAAAAVAAGIPSAPSLDRPIVPVGLAAVATAIAALAIDADATWQAIEDVGNSRDVVVVSGGGLIAVFLAGAAIGRVLHPFAQQVRGTEDTLSLLIAAAVGCGVRAAIGLDALP